MLDLGIDLNLWPWVWLGVGVFFAVIELTVLAGSFVLLPFAISAFAAALLGFYDVAIEIQWARLHRRRRRRSGSRCTGT